MIIPGEKIQLRFPILSDLKQILIWENEDESGMVNWSNKKINENEIFEWFNSLINDLPSEKQLRFIILDKFKGDILGSIDLFEFDELNQTVGVGIIINPDKRNRGIATESLKLVLAYCFKNLKIKNIWCHIDLKNIQSIRLFEKFGFKILNKTYSPNLNREILFLQLNLSV